MATVLMLNIWNGHHTTVAEVRRSNRTLSPGSYGGEETRRKQGGYVT